MSRIGKLPIALPAGVSVEFKNGVVTVKGAKGTLTREVVGNIDFVVEGTTLLVKALDDKAEITDDCSAVERLGMKVVLTEGAEENFKLTTQGDLRMARGLLCWMEENG